MAKTCTCEDNKLGDLLTYALMAFVLFALAAFLIKSSKQEYAYQVVEEVLIDEINIEEAFVLEPLADNTFEFEAYEPLPEIVIVDEILPRALPPLTEGGEVYFEEL